MNDMVGRKTRQNAYAQVLKARMGSLVATDYEPGQKPTEEYLLGLKEYAHQWISQIEDALAKHYKEVLKAEEAERIELREASTPLGE